MDPNNAMTSPPEPPDQFGHTRYDKYKAQQELAKAVGGSQEVICHAQSVFPFMMFPDDITVDREQVSIVHRNFFKMGEVSSIRIADILNVEANIGPFFGSLQISTRFFSEQKETHRINWLSRSDALRVKRILHGYLVAVKKDIDVSALSTAELSTMLDQLGRGDAEPET
jgi:hypothetical protein